MRRGHGLWVVLCFACGESPSLNTAAPDASTNAPDVFSTAPDATAPDIFQEDAAPMIFPDAETFPDAAEIDAGFFEDASVPTSTSVPALPNYSEGTCPQIIGGRTSSTSVISNFVSRGISRQFRLLVPRAYDGSRPFPVVFAWHWLNASSASFVRDGELETAVEEMQMIAVLPDKKLRPNGDKAYFFDWPFAEPTGNGIEEELVFFEDMLACVAANYSIDRRRIYGIGVSAGALWLTHLSTTERVNYFAAVEVLSGGLGEVAGAWRMNWAPQNNKFPALVLWGGANDWLGLSFDRASQRYRDELLADGHFVVTCVHDAGHMMPPIQPPAGGGTRFVSLWRFMLDHTYGLPPGTSPYRTSGLPDVMPSWCSIAGP